MKQARLNSTVILRKYEDMLDPLDLNSVPGKLIYSSSSLPTLSYRNLKIILFLSYVFFVQQSNCHFPWSMISVVSSCKCMLCD